MSSKGPQGDLGPTGDDSLKPEGFSGHGKYEKGIAPIKPLQVTPGMTLSTLSEEYIFFNHGVLFSYGELPMDPAEEYVAEFGSAVKILLAPKTLFKGLAGGNPLFTAWEHALVLVPKEDWEGLVTCILQTAIINRDTGTCFRPYIAELTIHDWLQSPIATEDNVVSAAVFGLDGNKQFIGFKESRGCLRVNCTAPRPETIQFGEQLIAGQNPYDEPDNNGSE
jgi:hypothetical protein